MRSAKAILLTAMILLLSFASLPGPRGPVTLAGASHQEEVECPESPAPEHDGIVAPGEYAENFFDPKTKILAYFKCSDDTNRTMHVAMVSPWEGWTEIRLQAVEAWNGDLNVVRVSLTGSDVTVVDGFLNGTTAQYVDDISLGGSDDILHPVAGHSGDTFVYEFAVPLLSADSLDCQLTGEGSFYFQLAYTTLERDGVEGPSLVESDPHTFKVGKEPMSGRWTSIDLSLESVGHDDEASEVLLTLRDIRGYPIAARPVSVFLDTAFGFLELGTAVTNEQGVGAVPLTLQIEGEHLVGAAFVGASGLLASVAWANVVIVPSVTPETFLPGSFDVIQAVIVMVVGGVWAAFAYSFFSLRMALRRYPRDTSARGPEHER